MSDEQHTFAAKCREHWERMNHSDPAVLRKRILEIFSRHTNQQDVVVDLYRLVLPEWDRIKKLDGYPGAGRELTRFICRRFQEFDRAYHPDYLPGGAWINWGFSISDELDPWGISFENCTPVF